MNEEQVKALDKVATYLAKRDHSIKELSAKLSRHFDQDVVIWAVCEANERGWLVPPEELAAKVVKVMNRKKKSFRYTQQYLFKMGLPEQSRDPDIEFEKAKTLIDGKYSEVENLSLEQKKKAYNYLSNRGYDKETIFRVINYENE